MPAEQPRSSTAAATATAAAAATAGMGPAGPRLREIRLQRGLSLSAVAAAAGVTKGFLSLAERGLTRASVPTLLQICGVLDIGIGDLFEYPREPTVDRGVPLDMGGIGIQEYLLTPRTERRIQVMRTELQPGGGSGGSYGLDTDTIFVTVLQGTFQLTVDGTDRLLRAGESTLFPGRSPHAWINPGSTGAEVLWVLAPPLPTEITSSTRSSA